MIKLSIKLFLPMLLVSLALFTVSCSDSSSEEKFITTFIDDVNTTVIDSSRDYHITVHALFDDGSKEDVTSRMVWSSSDETMATVSQGVVSSSSVLGNVTITYASKELNDNGSAFYEKKHDLEIRDLLLQSIELEPTILSMFSNTTAAVTASGTFEDNATKDIYILNITDDCNWTSSNTSVATVSKGVVSALAEGNTTITATDSNVSETLELNVTTISYTNVTLSTESDTVKFNVEQTLNIIAKGVRSDTNERVVIPSDEISYTSDDEAVVTLEDSVATAQGKGDAVITGTLKSDKSVTSNINLTVDKDIYVRLFKNDEELSFPYKADTNSSDNGTDTYKLRAVGKSFEISNMSIKTLSVPNTIISDASFNGISNGETIDAGVDMPFTLTATSNPTWNNSVHKYYFDLDSDVNSSFEVDMSITE